VSICVLCVYLHLIQGAEKIGDQFGTIQLAGHGVGFMDTPSGIAAFEQEFEQAEYANGTPLSSSDLQGFGIPDLIPEPMTLGLLGVGLLGLAAVRRRRS
jgi:hypothetical protein